MSQVETVFQGRRFRVERCTRDARGRPHVYEIVAHPGAAVVLPLLADGRVVLIQNYRVAVGAELLELPAGTLNGTEPPAACAARELAEETGYRAGRLIPLISFYSSPGICTERLHSFLATDLVPGASAPDAGEQIRVAPLELDEALAAIPSGRIVDAKTIATLLYYDRFARGARSGA